MVRAELSTTCERYNCGDDGKVLDVTEKMLGICRDAAPEASDAADAMKDYMDGLMAHSEAFRKTTRTAGLNIWQDAFKSFANASYCAACCAQSHWCGSDWRRNIVTATDFGLCLKSFRDLLDDALSIAQVAYSRADVSLAPKLKLHTAGLDSNVGAVTSHFGVGAQISRTGDVSIVRLNLDPARFSRDTYLVTLCVFFHEIFCHAACGIPASTAQGTPFSEGWMDWVGTTVLEQYGPWVPGWKSPAVNAWADVTRLAREYHRGRVDPRDIRIGGPQNALGARAAQSLYFLFAHVCGTPDNPSLSFTHFARFSMQVNASQLPEADRLAILMRVYERLSAAPTPSDAGRRAPADWTSAVEKYISTDGKHPVALLDALT